CRSADALWHSGRQKPSTGENTMSHQVHPLAKASIAGTTTLESLPMYFPAAPFALGDAIVCVSLVATAYDQFNQWAAQDYPAQSDFKWQPEGPLGFTYSAALWGTP